jgi:transposase
MDECTTTIGIDVGDRYCHLAQLDEQGELVLETRIRTEPKAIEAAFCGRAPARCVLETGTHSGWIARSLQTLGHEVIVANPRKVRMCSELKTDRRDAEFLARLARVDPKLLHAITVRSEETQVGLTVLRSRDTLVAARTKLINHVRAMVKNLGHRLPRSSAPAFHKLIEFVPETLRETLAPLMHCIAQQTAMIKEYDRRIERLCKHQFPETAVFRQVNGVGPITALCFLLVVESPSRFPKSRSVGSYLGLCPRQSQSGQSSPQLRITKAGDPLLRRYLVSAAQYILGPFGTDSDLRRWGLNLAARGGKNGKKRAVVAVARRLAVLLLALWRTGEEYDPLRIAPSTDSTSAA